ncbi:MAG: glucose-1-phosphate adenylyltransferase subunit GlgD [Lachnospiraceae bacterium]|nr:glucose-1-phosphate adenylyltransferase subunit GlgD [Lachnospiraceae bacterium]
MERVMGVISANYSSDELGSLTDQRTIASLPFGGRYRLIDFPLSNMVNSGISTLGIFMPYRYRSIIDHVGAGKEWGLDRKIGGLYILPGSVFGVNSGNHKFLLRDMRRNMVFLQRSQRPYVLMSATSCVNNMDYAGLLKQHIDTSAGITMVVKKCDKDNPYLNAVETEFGAVRSIRKGVRCGEMAFIDCFIINHELLMKILDWYMAVDYKDLFDALSADLDKIKVCTYEFDGYSRSIHSKEAYFRTSMELLRYSVRQELFNPDRPVTTKILDMVPTVYSAKSKVENALIPTGCTVNGTVKDSILFRGVKVEEGAKVKNSIIMQNCVIKRGAIVENAILDRYNVIGSGSVIKGTEDDILVMDKRNNW